MQFSKELLALWGKKKAYENNQFYWLPVMAHLIDTGNIIKYLYNNYLNNSQRTLLGTSITPNLVSFLGYVHDIGKITPAFQEKASRPVNPELDKLLRMHLIANHINLPKLSFPEKTPHNLAGEVFLENNHTLNSYFGAIIGAHHGQPEAKREVQMQLLTYSENYGDDTWQKLRLEALNYGLAKLNTNEIKTLKATQLTQQQAILLTGLIIMADWLASNEYYFPLIKPNQDFNDLDMNKRFKTGITKWAKEDQWLPNDIKNFTSYFKQHFDFTPRPVQTQMLTDVASIKDPGLIIIEAPMGSGKTETALTASEILSVKKHKSGIFFALPTQATANAMFTRLENWLACENGTQGLKLMHGKANLNHDYQALTKAKYDVIVNSWYSKKLGTLEPFSVGTVDQLLSMGLKQRHLFLKHLGFSGKTVIIDEIHAYDTYMQSYLEKALMWLGSYNVPVIALSATLPFDKCQALVNAYLYSKHIKTKLENNNSYTDLSTIRISSNKARKVYVIKLTSDWHYDQKGNPVLVLDRTKKRLEFHKLIQTRTHALKYQAPIGIDKGESTLLSCSTGNEYGILFGNKLNEEVERLCEVNKKRNRARSKGNATGNKRYLKAKKRHRAYLDSQISHAVYTMLLTEKPSLIVKENLTFTKTKIKSKDKSKAKIHRYLSSWLKGELNDRIEYLCQKYGIGFEDVNPAYTSQYCPNCGHKFLTRYGKHHSLTLCKNCGEMNANISASKNILKRKDDKEINLYTPYKKVQEILEQRAI